MPILAIDYGAKKVGLAKSNESESLALPLDIIANQNKKQLLASLQAVCQEHEIKKIIVGVPVSLPSNQAEFIRDVDLQNKQVQEVLQFIDWLKSNIELPVEMEDERLSTKLANTLNKGMIKNGSDDDVAAMLILQNYLDKKNI